MKIHIAQKGDSLHKIASKYGVSTDQLKTANSQLSNPDLIMPGMKIKVPSAGSAIKKSSVAGAGSRPPKEYVKEVQVKEPASEPQNLGVTEEEEPVPQAETVTDQPAGQQPTMQQPSKEYQMPAAQQPQKEIQMTAPAQKEVPIMQAPSKEIPVVPAPAAPEAAKPPAPTKDTSKFSVNILPQPPKPPAKGFNVANEFKVGAADNKPEKAAFTLPAASKANTEKPAEKPNNNFNFVAPAAEQKPAADQGMPSFTAPIAAKPAPELVSPAAEKPNMAAPLAAQPNAMVAPAAGKEGTTAPAVNAPLPPATNMPNLFPTADQPMNIPQVPPAMNPPVNMPNLFPAADQSLLNPMANQMPQVSPAMEQPSFANNAPVPGYGSQEAPMMMPSYGGQEVPVVMPAYDNSLMYGQPPYAPQPYPAYQQPMPYMPQPYPAYQQPMPYMPQPYPAYQQPMPYMPQPYPAYQQPYQQETYPAAVQGAYMQPESSSFMMPNHQGPYESSSLQMPGAANNAPFAPYAQDDCGCDEPPAYVPQPTLYAPQPGGMYGQPYYPTYPQAAYYQSMPYVPYAPQPGAPYYRPEQASMFGVPSVEEDED
ncbi:SafA/ExsA family spore coat assembly protein [Ectobacillus ponti]|uniref:SafA/ExsA family spore coat assembly protein n=1 Tax=Ectobacillus ponti TaxID=2961894 RepID=A0AA42BNC1_9BACI|nr:SafA/ExsA family spore coat assembly protein [Ectobacillus ponti]